MGDPLRRRLATAGVLAPVSIVAVLTLPTGWLALLLALLICFAAFEWAGFFGWEGRAARLAYVALVCGAMLAVWLFVPRSWDQRLMALAVLWWGGIAILLTRIRQVGRTSGFEPMLIPVGLFVLLPPWIAIVRLHGATADGPWLVVALMMLIWIADSLAFFSGRRWGRRKLAPALSPGKTYAGVYGALLGAAVWGAVLAGLLALPLDRALLLVILCAMVAAVSVVGDLFESLMKRRRGLKDAGRLLPGHGGVLDRIDSMTAAAPLFALGLSLLGRIG
jgi:phosphatidate cytidylyltransferase